ncbi:unnamed protein product [Prorocentrum cordatum]|uniref:Apple domain-containing protein n=2 Tax=Prorocentrum cordatum TaxID=2364126 RepID=A0ABN9PMW4_9DINO|nr:unnamed protein product [Polarella glacialis]
MRGAQEEWMQRPCPALLCLLLPLSPVCADPPAADGAECLAWRGDGGCEGIRDEARCLGSRDGRPWRRWGGLALAGQPCAWCGGGSCTAQAGGALCMPHAWVRERVGITVANCSGHGTSAPHSAEGEYAAVAAAASVVAGGAQFEVAADGTRCGANASEDSDLFNKFYWTFTAASVARCESLCASRRYCTGYEYEASRGDCQLWWRSIDAVEQAPAGRACARRRPAGPAPAQERKDLRKDDPESALAGATAPLAGRTADTSADGGDGPAHVLDAAAAALRRGGPSRLAWLLMLSLLTLGMAATACFLALTPPEPATRGCAFSDEGSDGEQGAAGPLLQADGPEEHGVQRRGAEGAGFKLLPPPMLLRRLHDASWLYKPLASTEPMDFLGSVSPAGLAPAASWWQTPAAGAAAAGPPCVSSELAAVARAAAARGPPAAPGRAAPAAGVGGPPRLVLRGRPLKAGRPLRGAPAKRCGVRRRAAPCVGPHRPVFCLSVRASCGRSLHWR